MSNVCQAANVQQNQGKTRKETTTTTSKQQDQSNNGAKVTEAEAKIKDIFTTHESLNANVCTITERFSFTINSDFGVNNSIKCPAVIISVLPSSKVKYRPKTLLLMDVNTNLKYHYAFWVIVENFEKGRMRGFA